MPTLEAQGWRAYLPFTEHAYPAGPTTTTPCARGPRPRGGLNVMFRMPSLTVFTDDVATELDSPNFFCPGSSQATRCFAEKLPDEERDKLRRERSELMVLGLPTGVERDVPLRTLCREKLVDACRMTLRIISSSFSLPNHENSQSMSNRAPRSDPRTSIFGLVKP